MKGAYFSYIASLVIFGSIGVFVRGIALPSAEIVAVRTVLGSLFLWALLLIKRKPLDREAIRANRGTLLLGGVALALGWAFLFEAYENASISVATLLYYCAPAIVVLASPLILKERLTRAKLLGVGAALAGMALLSGLNGGGSLRGVVFGLASALMYAALVFINKFIRGVPGLQVTVLQLTVAAFVMVPYALLSHRGSWLWPDAMGIAALAILALFHTGFACYLYFSSILRLPGQTVALYSYIDPVSALLFSAVFLGERLTAAQVAGAVLILAGAAFAELYKGKRKELSHEI